MTNMERCLFLTPLLIRVLMRSSTFFLILFSATRFLCVYLAGQLYSCCRVWKRGERRTYSKKNGGQWQELEERLRWSCCSRWLQLLWFQIEFPAAGEANGVGSKVGQVEESVGNNFPEGCVAKIWTDGAGTSPEKQGAVLLCFSRQGMRARFYARLRVLGVWGFIDMYILYVRGCILKHFK